MVVLLSIPFYNVRAPHPYAGSPCGARACLPVCLHGACSLYYSAHVCTFSVGSGGRMGSALLSWLMGQQMQPA